MLSALFSGMHCHTRSSKYVDRKKMKRTVKANRPGSNGFSFTGEFPEVQDWTPVEALGRRRSYTSRMDDGIAEVVKTESVERLPVVNRYGVRRGTALVALVVFAVMLASMGLMAYADNISVSKRLDQQTKHMGDLTETTKNLQGDIASRSNGVNIRQEAMRIGMKKSQGMDVVYLYVPSDAVLDPGVFGMTQDMASILGQ